ncbi:glycosyltransferase [Tessaracoccus palaemonis]|uniref:Glycosyltransferase n=1 Tax=Tessaracoccus palaemonis TaxID=2829499 RepID=A0ABX8SLX7_9ACTN|nr:glycosyltransferase [Tessaracoccus palaemonis]QXT63422.1 glycosyltransferase [Tessaracoccus palaemonis]
MRILSVVTLISPLGEYGGPVRVAVNQAKALQDRGHQVQIIASTRGFPRDEVPTQLDGVPLHLFRGIQVLPGAGFAGLAAPGLWAWLLRHVRSADVVHVHAARDLVTLPAAAIARLEGVPYFLQTHGMIDPSDNPLARPLDALMTRPVLRGAREIFHLTALERSQLLEVAGPALRLAELANGVPLADPPPVSVAGPEVLFLARLAPRKRPMLLVDAARALHEKHPRARFTIVGPDEGEGPAVKQAVREAVNAGVPVAWEGPLGPDLVLERTSRSTIYVLPSINEPYPMSVLEAMSVGRPVIITDTCGLAPLVERAGAGIVVGDSTDAFVDAVDALLSDPQLALDCGRRGREFVRSDLTMEAIAASLEQHYASALA